MGARAGGCGGSTEASITAQLQVAGQQSGPGSSEPLSVYTALMMIRSLILEMGSPAQEKRQPQNGFRTKGPGQSSGR